MRPFVACSTLVVAVLLASAGTSSQTLSRTATTLEAVLKYPAFFHDKAITVAGQAVPIANGQHLGLAVPAPKLFALVPQSGQPPSRAQEYRGRVFDIGRFTSDDSRLGTLNLFSLLRDIAGERWPTRETVFALTGVTWADPPGRSDTSLRALALMPQAFNGRAVTVRGRFRGRNLLGDLPAWPRLSEHDFVIQAGDGAVWVLGRRPRGDGFDLSPTNRAHTGRWLEVTGQVEVRDELPVIVATGLKVAPAEDDAVPDAPDAPLPSLGPPEVIFSAPLAGETDVPRDVVVRIQFSRPMRASTLEGQISVAYAPGVSLAIPRPTMTYRPGPMAVEIRFAEPLAPGVEVVIQLGTGLLAADGAPLGGQVLRFTTSSRGWQP